MTVGVPEIAPFEDESDNPDGREGEIDHDVTVPETEGVTVDMAMFCVSSKMFGEYEMVGAERPLVIIGSWVGDVNSAGGSSSNQLTGFSSERASVMVERVQSFSNPSEDEVDRASSMMPAERDMVIINATRNNDLNVFCCGARDSANWPMLLVLHHCLLSDAQS